MSKVIADFDRCIGAGMCVTSAPSVFDQQESDGTVVVLMPNPDGSDLEDVRDAVLVCPAAALLISE